MFKQKTIKVQRWSRSVIQAVETQPTFDYNTFKNKLKAIVGSKPELHIAINDNAKVSVVITPL
jgi:hypothetical protein